MRHSDHAGIRQAARVLAFGLSVLAAGVLLSSGAAGAAGPPALTLILGSYVQAGWHATSIRMCARGGGCATRPVVVPDTITRPGPGGQREMVPSLKAMSFGRLIPDQTLSCYPSPEMTKCPASYAMPARGCLWSTTGRISTPLWLACASGSMDASVTASSRLDASSR